MENVGAITFRGLDNILLSLTKIGYDAEWQDIRASDLGAPHRRERIWILAYPDGIKFTKCYALQNNNKIVKPGGNENRSNIQTRKKRNSIAECVGSYFSETRNDDSMPIKYGDCLQGIKDKWTIEPDIYRVAYGIPFGMDRLKCIGNAIVPEIAEMIWLIIKPYF
jgi:DNA (cytosine-5)-methyltransferase 1